MLLLLMMVPVEVMVTDGTVMVVMVVMVIQLLRLLLLLLGTCICCAFRCCMRPSSRLLICPHDLPCGGWRRWR